MSFPAVKNPFIAIACGGTGGHLFPGLAIATQLRQRGCDVALLVSAKDVDQQAIKSIRDMEIFTLPAVALQNKNYFSFAVNFLKSFRLARKIFRRRKPDAVIAMGGFTSAPPVLAAKISGAQTYLHESNTIPGRANRFLARFVSEAFVGFPEAAMRLKARKITATGTPVRSGFTPERDSLESARAKLGLQPQLPTLLITGGSQGARGLNEMILSALPLLAQKNWQWLHLTGASDFEKVKSAYAAQNIVAVVKPFLAEMDLALAAATVCVSRSGASSLAEIATTRTPALLVPFPAAADNHQVFNALAFGKNGAAKILEQKNSTPEKTAALLVELMENEETRLKMQAALTQWDAPQAAEKMAETILQTVAQCKVVSAQNRKAHCQCAHHRAQSAHGS